MSHDVVIHDELSLEGHPVEELHGVKEDFLIRPDVEGSIEIDKLDVVVGGFILNDISCSRHLRKVLSFSYYWRVSASGDI